MKEHPILFTGPMVRAILEGRKTQTRRPIKPQPPYEYWCLLGATTAGFVWSNMAHANPREPECLHEIKRPYDVGDRLWVREMFASFKASGTPCSPGDASYAVMVDGAQQYRDGASFAGLATYAPGAHEGIKWRPSIHMPRWASRITLEVTDIRPERVKGIPQSDAIAEGIEYRPAKGMSPGGSGTFHASEAHHASTAREAFALLWDSIYGGGPLAWAENPWTWATTFKVVTL